MIATLRLIQNQKLAAVLFVIASVIIIIASDLEENVEIQKENGVKIAYTPTPAQITLFAIGIITLGTLIFAYNATVRLDQINLQMLKGKAKGTLRPHLWNFAGSWLFVFGAISLLIGSKIIVEEESEIEIL
ncbi:hypothetical protein LPY66_13395 [Dehalobacter sp. DCM]|uniref:hypothetical protein n=1 Tax=Dehalobacter sp. DCM TaxID=2907827 RepID=UPI003081350A|nr:hypothetical protein LPY66_13395 [Dehalobacter sp. DCM]